MALFEFSLVDGLRPSKRRAIGFLEDRSDPELNAASCFSGLKSKHEYTLRSHFDYWIDEGQPKDNWFHGWPNEPIYKECFTFKWKDNKINERLYGFLCNPNVFVPALRVCVLVFHDTKTDKTNYRLLDRINIIRTHADALGAIRKAF